MVEPQQENSDTSQDKGIAKVVAVIGIAIAILYGVLLVSSLIAGLYWFIGPTTPTEKKDFVQATALIMLE